jgi:NADH/F420H2 dehydrogenase subunit C
VRILREQHADAILEVGDDFGDLSILIEPTALLQVAETLKTHPELDYCFLMDIAGVDRFKDKPRFEVVYNFYSMSKAKRVRIKVRVPEDDAYVDSLCGLWKGADWFEREAWDMMGVVFRGHPRLERILTHQEFVGHALRKDYDSGKRQPLSRSYDLFTEPAGPQDED